MPACSAATIRGGFHMVLFCHNEEPTLDELLSDNVLHLLLTCDGLTVEDVRALVDAVRQELQATSGGPERPSGFG
jgi:hypothetical protein